METGKLYFWTATIHNCNRLLAEDFTKQIIIESLLHLCQKQKIKVYGFVIMPNHIHLIWQMLESNGKESSYASFLKYTAHKFQKYLCLSEVGYLNHYKVDVNNKSYEFWQRDSLAVELYTYDVACQKLDYIHNNPVALHWQLCENLVDYKYSSAAYYDTGIDQFGLLSNLFHYFNEVGEW